MPAALAFLFIAVPFLAASALEFEGFIALVLLFCVAAGLAGPPQNGASASASRLRRQRQAQAQDEALRGDRGAVPGPVAGFVANLIK